METRPEGTYKSFSASPKRLELLRKLTLEFAGVVIEETPSKTVGDFMTHVGLTFTSAEQGEVFMSRMFELGRQESEKRNQSGPIPQS